MPYNVLPCLPLLFKACTTSKEGLEIYLIIPIHIGVQVISLLILLVWEPRLKLQLLRLILKNYTAISFCMENIRTHYDRLRVQLFTPLETALHAVKELNALQTILSTVQGILQIEVMSQEDRQKSFSALIKCHYRGLKPWVVDADLHFVIYFRGHNMR